MMESQQLSLLSSLTGELKPEDYVQPHYKESYRLAIDSLVNKGRESYQEFLKGERLGSFLSEDELLFITTNAEQPSAGNQTETIDGSPESKSSTGTYWPIHSDVATPDLDLGWPEVMLERLLTNIDLLFHPPRQNKPTIKEVIRKLIQDARQVIAIVMDIFTDVDIFKETVEASIRGVPVYVLLDDSHLQSFLSMAENQDIQVQKLRNMRVRTVKGQDYLCRSGAKFHGAMEQKFLLVDCQTAVYGSYSFMWSYEKINLSMVQVITGQLVESYDEEFRTLYARSTVPEVLSPPESVLLDSRSNGRRALAKYGSQSGQAFERKDQLRNTLDTVYRKACERQMGVRELEERLYEDEPFEHKPMINPGVGMLNRVHQFQPPETMNFMKRHSYAGERQEVSYIPQNTTYRASNWNVAGNGGFHGPPGSSHYSNAMEDYSQMPPMNQMYRGHNMRQSYHGNDKQVLSMQQNMPTLEPTSKSFLRTWRIESYLNNNDVPIGDSGDYLDQYETPENKAGSLMHSRVRSSIVYKSTIPEQPETNKSSSSIRQIDPSAVPNSPPYYSSMQWSPAAMENRMRNDELKRRSHIWDDPRNNTQGYGPARDAYASLGRAKGGLAIKNPDILQENWHKRHSVADPKSNIDYRDNRESSSHMYEAFMRRQPDRIAGINAHNGGYVSNLNEDQRSVSHYDVKNVVDIKSPPVSIWQEPPSRTVSAATLDVNGKESKTPNMGSMRLLNKSSKKIRSLLNIPEKKERQDRIMDRSSDTILAEEEEQRPGGERNVQGNVTKLQIDRNLFADDLVKSSAPRFSTEELHQNSPATTTSVKTQQHHTTSDGNERSSLASENWRKDQGADSRLYNRFEPFCSYEKKHSSSSHIAGSANTQAPERAKSILFAKSGSTSEHHSHVGQQTHGHHDNKLGRFIQKVGNFIHKNK